MRPHVTDKHLFPAVGAFSVRRAGGIVALHFGTPEGEFIFHLRERSFVKHARGRCDDQGSPYRTLEQIDAEQNRLAVDAAATPGKAVPPVCTELTDQPHNDARALSASDRAAYIAAYVDLRVSGETRREVANRHNLPTDAWNAWTYRHRDECEAAVGAARTPVLKPSGQLL